jgi:ferrous-iron efflux pump FieF
MTVAQVSANGGQKRLTSAESAKLTARITWLSVSVGLSLMIVKASVWWFSGSVSLLASAADSGLDFVAAMGTFWAVRASVAPADNEHRYGHGKTEAFASLLQAGLVFASAALIGNAAINRLLHPVAVEAQPTLALAFGRFDRDPEAAQA